MLRPRVQRSNPLPASELFRKQASSNSLAEHKVEAKLAQPKQHEPCRRLHLSGSGNPLRHRAGDAPFDFLIQMIHPLFECRIKLALAWISLGAHST
jgi:hypothetical protein